MSDEPWDQEAEHRLADFLHMSERMRQDHENDLLAVAESALAAMPSGDVPTPATAHPALERYAEMVRGATRGGPLRLAVVRPIAATYGKARADKYPTEPLPSPLTLERRKCAGPAPFVGDPRVEMAAYVWPVWVDDYGRHIAGHAEMVWQYR